MEHKFEKLKLTKNIYYDNIYYNKYYHNKYEVIK